MEAINILIAKFLTSGPANQNKQIISLGAGFDTTFFRLKV